MALTNHYFPEWAMHRKELIKIKLKLNEASPLKPHAPIFSFSLLKNLHQGLTLHQGLKCTYFPEFFPHHLLLKVFPFVPFSCTFIHTKEYVGICRYFNAIFKQI